jgi:hypothetical protein
MVDAPAVHITDRELVERITESAAGGRPLRVQVDGKRYVLHVRPETPEVTVKDDIWADYDPEKVREAIEKYAGSWSDLDRDELIENLYRARKEGSRPPERP